MRFKSAVYPGGKSPARQELRLGGNERRLDGGLNVFDLPFGLEHDQASDMVNLLYRDGGLCKRDGQTAFAALPGGRAARDAVYDNHGTVWLFDGITVYALEMETKVFTAVYTADAETNGSFARFGPDVYFTNGTIYGKCTKEGILPPTPYIPLVITGRSPDGIAKQGTAYESFNGLTDTFRISFDCDGVSTRFVLPRVDGFLSAETESGAVLTYDSATRTISCESVLPVGDTVTAAVRRTGVGRITGDEAGVHTCRQIAAFAGDGRIYLCGNGTNILYPSAKSRPDYFPSDLAVRAGNCDEITAVGRQYDTLVVFKTHETLYAEVGSETHIRCLNPIIGCDMPGSIQTVGNRLVFANTDGGVYIVVSTSRESERNVQPISRNIDPMLMAEDKDACLAASSVCFEGRYHLCIGDHVYVWDYTTRPYIVSQGTDNAARRLGWYYFENVEAGTWFIFYHTLYRTDRTSGRIAYFSRKFDDFGVPVRAYWKSPMLDFGLPHVHKRIDNIWFVCRADRACRNEIRYLYDMYDGTKGVEETEPIAIASFNWHDVTWKSFLWAVAGLFKTLPRRPHRRRVIQFAVELKNDTTEDLSVVDVVTAYREEYRLK